MTWNYRVLRHPVEKREDGSLTYLYSIHEVYYNEEGQVVSWTASPISLEAYSVRELQEDWEAIREAFTFPVLDSVTYEEIKEEWVK